MPRSRRGISYIMSIVLVLVIVLLAVVALWGYMKGALNPGQFVTATLTSSGQEWVNGKPFYTLDLAVNSKANNRIIVDDIKLLVVTKSGKTGYIEFTVNQTTSTTTTTAAATTTTTANNTAKWVIKYVGIDNTTIPEAHVLPGYDKTVGGVIVYPNRMMHFTIMLVGNSQDPLVSVSATLHAHDDAGNTYTFKTAVLSLTS